MELRHLEQIVAIASCGGFSGAARRLNISQSTLSKSIARLETQLAVQLFYRDGAGARPTAYGQFLAARGETLLSDVRELGRDFDRLVHGETGRLRMGVGPAPSITLLRAIVAGMAERYPKLALHTAQDNARRLVRDLVDGAYDAVFVYHEAANPFEDLVRVKVLEQAYVALVRPGHPANQGAPLGPAELLNYRIAGAHPGSAFYEWVGSVTAKQSENLKGFRSDSYALIRDRAVNDDFIVIAPRFVFEDDVAAGLLVEVPTTWRGVYECWMLTTRERWRGSEMKALADISRLAGRAVTHRGEAIAALTAEAAGLPD
jgi:DNA-binding transcriptional LysR family regulator